MGGVLNFTLGLNNAQFLSRLSTVSGAVNSFVGGAAALAGVAGGFASVGLAVGKVGQQISEGGRLADLGTRLSELPGSIFQVEYALDQVGGSAGNAAGLITLLNKSLGGVNEQGEPTGTVFAQLGLSIEELSKLDAPGKLQAIAKAMSGLGQEQKTALAGKIFGKGGAQDFLSIANSAGDFADALKESAERAAQITRNAAAFDRIGDTFKKFKTLKADGFFAGIAEGVAPALQLAGDKLNTLDLTAFGQRIGNAFTIGFQAFNTGQFGELFELELKSAMPKGSNFMLGEIASWSDAVAKAFSAPGGGEKMGFFENVGVAVTAFPQGLAGFGLNMVNEAFGDFGGPGVDRFIIDKLLGNFEGWMDYSAARGGWFGSKGILDGVNPDGTDPFEESVKVFREKLLRDAEKAAEGFIGPMPKPGFDKVLPPDLFSGAGLFGAFMTKLGTNSLERVGARFGMGSGGNPVETHARNIVTNTQRTNQILERVARRLEVAPQPVLWKHE